MNKLALIFSICLISAQSMAIMGTSSGGGGKGVVCRDLADQIISVEFLDLWEARVVHKRKVQYSNQDLNEQVASGLVRLANVFKTTTQNYPQKTICESTESKTFSNTLACKNGSLQKASISSNEIYMMSWNSLNFLDEDRAKDNINWITEGSLSLTQDSYESVKPKGRCQIEQIINLKTAGPSAPSNLFEVDEDLWLRMDKTNQAAAILHETMYSYLRYYAGETNSIRVRRAIAYLMSGYEFAKWSDLLTDEYIQCQSVDKKSPHSRIFEAPLNEFFMNQNGDFIFTHLMGIQSLGFEVRTLPKDYDKLPPDMIEFNKRYFEQEVNNLVKGGFGGLYSPIISKINGQYNVELGCSNKFSPDANTTKCNRYVKLSDHDFKPNPNFPDSAEITCERKHK